MIETNVLLGNGLNIEFSENDDYKNWAILQRMNNNLGTRGRYDDVFAGLITADDMHDFLVLLNEWFKNKALKGIAALRLVSNEDELRALLEMSKRYSGKDPGIFEIGLEDYLLGLKLFNESFGEKALDDYAVSQGVGYLMLDAIYNNGAIEEIYPNMKCFKPYLLRFKNIFTLNYDSNVDVLVGHPIFHLHGTFKVLHHEYRPDTFKGWAMLQIGKTMHTYIAGKEYLYCDAILGFSGKNKLEKIQVYNEAYESPLTQNLLAEHPELERPKYPIEQFRQIKGQLHLIGVCPNNDSHIFEMINKNPNIAQVIYYSASDDDALQAQKVIKKSITFRNVFKYWDKVRAGK